VVSFTPRSKNPPYPFDRRLGGTQKRSGRREEEKILDTIGTRTPDLPSSSPQPVVIPTALCLGSMDSVMGLLR
jgi:hypothetical protein